MISATSPVSAIVRLTSLIVTEHPSLSSTVTGNCGRGTVTAAGVLPAVLVRVAIVVPLRVAVLPTGAVTGRPVACVVGVIVAPAAVGAAVPPHAARISTESRQSEISLGRGRNTARILFPSKRSRHLTGATVKPPPPRDARCQLVRALPATSRHRRGGRCAAERVENLPDVGRDTGEDRHVARSEGCLLYTSPSPRDS